MNDETLQAKMSGNAKNLYSVLLDRYELSAKKGFTNSKGQIICKMKQAEMAEAMGCGVRSVPKYIDELKLHNLISIELGLCKMYEIQVFQIGKNCSFKTAKIADLNLQELPIQNGKNCRSHTYKPNTLSQITKPNARMRTKGSEQAEANQNQLSEATSRHHFSQSELGNSRIPSEAQGKTQSQAQGKTQDKTQAQDKTQEPKATRQWLDINDKPSYISEQVWQDFCAYKRERRHNFTATGKKAFFAKLDEIQAKSGACETAIKNTMANGWQGVFMPPLDKRQGQTKGQSMQPAQMVDALQEWLSDREAQVVESELALPSRAERRA